MKKLKTLQGVNLESKKVLMRVDFNVPLNKETGEITDNSRIKASLPTIEYLLKQKSKIILISHLGRPEGTPSKKLSLEKVAANLSELLNEKVQFIDKCVGKEVEEQVKNLKDQEILMLENIRFHKEEQENNPEFAKILSDLGDIYVNDAFGVCHREDASVAGITKYMDSYAGLLLEKEIVELTKALNNPKPPVTIIMGGAKIETKIDILKNFINKADNFIIGGGLANTFLAACGYNIGDSLYEKDKKEIAQEIMLQAEKNNHKFILPKDAIVASEIKDNAETLEMPIKDIEGDMRILDIGPMTRTRIHQIIQKSNTIIWNGPMGLSECKPFENGTKLVAQEIAKSKALTILGGGDTLEALERFNIGFDKYTHVSTGGGAMLDFLSGKELPGIKPLFK
ncbi:MAG: Phosphoglycerate kinase [Candidatus Peregrinibacteria bacterium GW2011_GWA2_33_10]|nr:MAG: Phosphoglycerate kinase [Candidatus Peregrinibacteria bacterium GW2011_GWA2_33_10]KKP41294.1 MAG: phosphoglycerate kinase, phosphoglycerate kinase [Candidatus Peregrinibacteria bacterium GW2011_GWC2_33_13]OGJ49114.1 MAG: phosphoglycerate kinase [Candidatus Peregrinibacteria bacterium RIFOXYA2_FULL_33_7]